MAAYLVLMHQVDDVERYRAEYIPAVTPFLRRHGAEVLVGSFEAETAEGSPPNSAVVLRFPDADAARAFLEDPDYQPVKGLRHSLTSRGQAVIVPGYEAAV